MDTASGEANDEAVKRFPKRRERGTTLMPSVRAGITAGIPMRKERREVLSRSLKERESNSVTLIETRFPYGPLGRTAAFIENLVVNRPRQGSSMTRAWMV